MAIICRHLGPDETDDETAARLAEWIRSRYRVAPALLGAYVRRMALAGDLAGALAEMRAGDAQTASAPASLIALGERAGAAAQASARQSEAVRGEQRRARYREAVAAIRPTRRTADPGGGPDPPAAAAT